MQVVVEGLAGQLGEQVLALLGMEGTEGEWAGEEGRGL